MKELQESQLQDSQKENQSEKKSIQPDNQQLDNQQPDNQQPDNQQQSQKNSRPISLKGSQQSFRRSLQQQQSQNQSRLAAHNQPVKQTSQLIKSSNLQSKNINIQNSNDKSMLDELNNQPDIVSQIVEDRNNSMIRNNNSIKINNNIKNNNNSIKNKKSNIQLANDNLMNESLDYNSFIVHDDNPPQYDQFNHKGAKFRLRANKTALYCQENVYKILQQGLIEMNKSNPKNPIRFLGVYLMEQSDNL